MLVKHCKVDKWVSGDAQAGIRLDKAAGLFTGETLLHIAIQSRQNELLKYLIDNGADLNTQVPLFKCVAVIARHFVPGRVGHLLGLV